MWTQECGYMIATTGESCRQIQPCFCRGDVCLVGGTCRTGNILIAGKPISDHPLPYAWDVNGANVVCKELGYLGGVPTYSSKYVTNYIMMCEKYSNATFLVKKQYLHENIDLHFRFGYVSPDCTDSSSCSEWRPPYSRGKIACTGDENSINGCPHGSDGGWDVSVAIGVECDDWSKNNYFQI